MKPAGMKKTGFGEIKNQIFGDRQRARNLGVILVLIASLSMGFFGGWLGSERHDNEQVGNTGISRANQQAVLNESELISAIAKNVGPSVVSVNVTSQSQQMSFFGFSQPSEERGAGTGIIISDKGYVLTNRHVVPAGTTDLSVTLSDGTELTSVTVVGRTSESDSLDVAILKINDTKGKKLVAANLADSSKVQVGDRVIAIGNALGQFQNTVTSGIISGFGRSLEAGDSSGSSETLQNMFQTDAAINQGNSGGPLVDASGNVIGINTAVAGGTAQNIGFAIPINDAKGLIKSVLDTGKFQRPYLGVRYVSLTDDYAYQYNLSVKRGAYVAPGAGRSSIIAGSPADKAGLQEKDVITKVNGTSIDENHSLTSLVGQNTVGDEVTLSVVRDGKTIEVKVRLEAAPGS
jgi:S1-C subfamily serine protease